MTSRSNSGWGLEASGCVRCYGTSRRMSRRQGWQRAMTELVAPCCAAAELPRTSRGLFALDPRSLARGKMSILRETVVRPLQLVHVRSCVRTSNTKVHVDCEKRYLPLCPAHAQLPLLPLLHLQKPPLAAHDRDLLCRELVDLFANQIKCNHLVRKSSHSPAWMVCVGLSRDPNTS